MAYHTLLYLCLFLPAVLLAYRLVPQRFKRVVLLLAGYLFFYVISGKLVVYLFAVTLLTHYVGIWLARLKDRQGEAEKGLDRKERGEIRDQYRKYQRRVLWLGAGILLAVLAYLKYYQFFADNLNTLFGAVHLPFVLEGKTLLLPVGISFYTLEAISYMADVYWGKIPAEDNLGKIALYLAFFPQIMEGPICSYPDTAQKLWDCGPLEHRNLSEGFVRICWGLFKKMVVADRLNVIVKTLFDNYGDYSGVMIAVAAIAYTVQLYMEFSGCMDIVIGSGQLFGITLPENFRQPFFSKTASEFWRRWHITLGVWFKSYIFYPVSVSAAVKKWNKFGKKHLGKYVTKLGTSAMALLPVWLCNGLWHGPRWSYIFYGIYYFCMILAGIAWEPVRNKLLSLFHINENAVFYRVFQILKTWTIIFAGELFFRANDLKTGIQMFRSMFHEFHLQELWDGRLLQLGLDRADYFAIVLGVVVVAIVGCLKERGVNVREKLIESRLPIRWGLSYALIFAVIIFGAYGAGYQAVDLIYAGF